MADRQISELTPASAVQSTDLFVLEQGGTAKKMTGQILINWMTAYADGHGGIESVTVVDSGTAGNGQLHTVTLHCADETTYTFSIRDGYKGEPGAAWKFFIKYAGDLPTSDSDMGDDPDNYIGVYYGTEQTAPTHCTDYDWFQWKGDRGLTGEAATIVSQSITYLASSSGTVVPEGSWTTTVPAVSSGNYLWTRTRLTFNDGTIVTSYSVGYMGVNGSGAVSTVNGVNPDGNGNIALEASDIPTSDSTSVQQHLTSVEGEISTLKTYEVRHISGIITSLPISYSFAFITADHRVINCELGTPSAVTSDLNWTTSAGNVTFTGTLASGGSTTIEFDVVKVVTP